MTRLLLIVASLSLAGACRSSEVAPEVAQSPEAAQSQQVPQTSDCGQAATAVEEMICGSPELSKLDEQMEAAFTQAGRTVDAAVIDQPAWRDDVRDFCDNRDCLVRTYTSRTSYLRELATLGGFSTADLVGEWRHADSDAGTWGTLRFSEVTASGFRFAFEGVSGNNSGMIDGDGIVRSGVGLAHEEFSLCRLALGRRDATLVVVQSPECFATVGAGVPLGGEYRKQ